VIQCPRRYCKVGYADGVCEGCGIQGGVLRSWSAGLFIPPPDSGRVTTVFLCRDCVSHVNRFRHYGITPEQFKALYDDQGGLCKICGSDDSDSRSGPNRERTTLFVDHCHKTGRIRGLLCNRCNTGISRFRDNHKLAEKAVEYLRAVQNEH
jgi:hypothetical protein